MIAATLSAFWATPAKDATAPEPPRRRSAPLFIGDATQPFGQDTLLLKIIRDDAARADRDDQP
jgi:hypothetical protein